MAHTLPRFGSDVHINGQLNGSDVSFEVAIETALPITVREHPAR